MILTSSDSFSLEADQGERKFFDTQDRLWRSNSHGHESLLDELFEVFNECRHPNWNGYDAMPVYNHTLRRACLFVNSLRLTPAPSSIGADPDGEISFEWYRDRNHLLTLSINETGAIHYAALIGRRKVNGKEFFDNRIPLIISNLIAEIIHE